MRVLIRKISRYHFSLMQLSKYKAFIEIMEDFEAKDILLVFLQDKIDRTTAMGRFF